MVHEKERGQVYQDNIQKTSFDRLNLYTTLDDHTCHVIRRKTFTLPVQRLAGCTTMGDLRFRPGLFFDSIRNSFKQR